MTRDKNADRTTLESALAILEPLAGLLLTRDIRYAYAENLLKAATVKAGAKICLAQGKQPSISGISLVTGVRRREVKRLLQNSLHSNAIKPTAAARAQLRWATDRRYVDEKGNPAELPYSATAGKPSFTSLAESVSKDVHPRTLLDEMVRIGAVAEADGSIVLERVEFQPSRYSDDLMRVAGANVGDHMTAVLMNLLCDPPPLVERAVVVDKLTRMSAEQGTELARELWRKAMLELAPQLQSLSDQDADVPDNGWRMRIGIYTYFGPEEVPKISVI